MKDLNPLFQLVHKMSASDMPRTATPRRPLRRASNLLSLEQRFMFDGAAVATAADAAHANPDVHAAALAAEASAAATAQVREADAARNGGKKEVAFVDTSVVDYQSLVAGISDGVAIVEFDGSKDGLAQIAEWAKNQSGYDAIHILSHGSAGKLNLGTTVLSEASLGSQQVQEKLAEIGRALNADGDLLLYGCDVAASDNGQRFIDELARITGADIAASTDATGAASKGGDWFLEAQVGQIDTDALHIDGYRELLDVVTFNDSEADYSSTVITRTIDGAIVTFTGGTGLGAGGMAMDAINGEMGLYAYEGTAGGNDIRLTITVASGYMFDLNSFRFAGYSGSLRIAVTYAGDVPPESFDINAPPNDWHTVSSFSKPTSRVTQVVLTSSDFGLFQDFDIDVRAIPSAPAVSDADISITSTPTGTGGVYKIGDTVTATWTNSAGSEADSVTMDFSQFGGPAAVVATRAGNVWTAAHTITAGIIDAANRNVSVKVTNAGGSTTAADTSNLAVDNVAPTVTDAKITISGGTGPGGAFKIGDTVTAVWSNTAAGDNNADAISGVTFDFSAFGGSVNAPGTNIGGIWTATHTIVAGSIDATNRNISVTATDNAGNTTTTADTTNATVDNIAPTVTDGNISISGATGTNGAYKIGDTVTVTWNNTAGGDNNADTLSAVTVDFSQFGGGTAVAATNVGGVWTATHIITAGSIDATNRNVSVRVTDNAGNNRAAADTTNATVDNVAPTVTLANIGSLGATGTGGTFKTGDVVTAVWDASIFGNNNTDTISSVTFDFSAFGGGTAVAGSRDGDGVWRAYYTISAGSIDAATGNISVTVTDDAGNTKTVTDNVNHKVDNIAPTVTDANVSISGGTGTGGAFRIGDTVTATWNNSAGGDNNADTLSSVTFDFSAFGGGANVAASNVSGVWTATYVITPGTIDATNKNVTVKVTDNAGNSTTLSDTTNATVDSVAPVATDGNISISGATGSNGAFRIGDTVTVTWDNTAAGDNNADTISGVTVDFSQFGGGTAVPASNSGGVWTATYNIVVGSFDGLTNRNVTVKVTDNAGNTTTTADTTNATVDNVRPTITLSNLAFSDDTGSSSSDFITNEASQTISATLSAVLDTGDGLFGSLDNGATWTDITDKVSGTTLSWDVTLTNSGTILLKVSDAAGNDGTALSRPFVLDYTAPGVPSTPDLDAASDTGASNTDNITSNNTPIITGTADIGSTVTLYDTDGVTVLGSAVVPFSGTWSIATSALSAGTHTITAKATDAAGNVSNASAGLQITIDTAAPASVALSNTTVASLNATSGATLATLSSTDASAVTYSLVAGNGSNDQDNGSFAISGDSLRAGGAPLLAGTYHILVRATDAAGNYTDQALAVTVVDAPSVSSIVRTGGAGALVPASASTISFTVTFSEPVIGVDTSDFDLTTSNTATGTIGGISTADNVTYTVTVADVSGDGTLRLDLKASGTGIQNGSSTGIVGGYAGGASYTLDHTAPAAPSTPDMTAGTDSGSSNSDNITANTTPTFTGTAESGSTVTLYDTDGITVIGTGTASGGTWSITTSALSAGAHTITAKATDAAGNTSAASSGLTVTIDTAAPTGVGLSTTAVATVNATAGATIATFSSTDASAVTYSLAADDGVTDAHNGSFSISGNSLMVGGAPLDVGSYNIYVAATDAAGNVSYQALTIDVGVAPSVSSIVRAGGADSTVAASAGSISYTVTFSEAVTGVDASDFTLSGTGTANGSIASVTGSGTTYTVTVNGLSGDGDLRLDLNGSNTGIRNGSNIDIAGGYTGGAIYMLDRIAPAAPSTPDMTVGTDSGTSNSDNITRNTTPTFTGIAEDGSTVTLYDTDGTTVLGSTTAAGGTWTITSSALSAGAHTITARATDAVGNTSSASAGLAVVIDTAAPTVVISSDVALLKAGQTATITFTFNEDPGSTFTWDGSTGDIVVSGGTLSAISGSGLTRTAIFTPTAGLDGGTASITVAAGSYTDAAGNAGGAGIAPVLAFDLLAPDAPSTPDMTAGTDSGTSNSDNITNNTTPTFTGTAEAGSIVTLYDSDGTVLGSTTATGGKWTITSSALGAGAHTITAKATDAAGNVSAASGALNITIDTLPPAAPTVENVSTVSLTPVLTGAATLETGGTLTVTIDGATYNVVPTGGRWSLDLASATPNSGSLVLVPGRSYTVAVTAADAAGNTSSTTGSLVIAAPPPPLLTVVPVAVPIDSALSGGAVTGNTVDAASPNIGFLPPGLEAVLNNSPIATSTLFSTTAATQFSPGAGIPADGIRSSQPQLTQSGAFRVVVIPSTTGGERLVVNRGIDDQVVPSGYSEIDIPADAFAHTDPNAAVELFARQANGAPLPSWLRFDASKGKFEVNPPKGMSGDITIQVVARDKDGREVVSIFHIRIGAKDAAQPRPQAEREGRSGLSEQIQLAARQRGSFDERLAGLARALQWPNG